MDITPLIRDGLKIIQSYKNNGYKIAGEFFAGDVIVTPDSVTPFTPQANNQISVDDLSALNTSPEMIIVGVNGAAMPLPPAARHEFRARGFASVDVMDIGSACRTYNVLATEGRNVAVFLFKPE